MALRRRGVVTRWNDTRGFGFIKMDGALPGDRKVFVHRTGIRPTERQYLMTGDIVWFSLEPGQKPGSMQAANLIIFEGDDPFGSAVDEDDEEGGDDPFGSEEDEEGEEGVEPPWPEHDEEDEGGE